MKALHILVLAAAFSIHTFKATHGEEIINGKKARKNSLQYMASVQLNNKHRCGGFLISPSYVLTAAHCGTEEPTHVALACFTANVCTFCYKNKISEQVNNKDVKVAKIPNKHQRVKPNIKCQVAGWGKNGKQQMVNDLMVADVSTIHIDVCKKQWVKVFPLPPNVLCAGGYKTKSGACQGDSGGPLVCSGLAVGIVSFNLNKNCSYPNMPNVYTEISAYADWINKVIKRDA